MKRTSHLFLLVPSLFLMASCQTTPKVDTITEEEAIKFIKENYHRTSFPNATTGTKIKWEIIDTKDSAGIDSAKAAVGDYINSTPVADLKGEVNITEERGKQYPIDLKTPGAFDTNGHDEIVGMNLGIYNDLYTSPQHKPFYKLTYKKGPDNGLIIISGYEKITKDVHTRIHTYNHEGLESKFEVACSMDDSKMQYKLTIDFCY